MGPRFLLPSPYGSILAGLACIPSSILVVRYVLHGLRARSAPWALILVAALCCGIGWLSFFQTLSPLHFRDISRIRR